MGQAKTINVRRIDIWQNPKSDQDCKNSGTIKHCLNKQSEQNSEINSKTKYFSNQWRKQGRSKRKKVKVYWRTKLCMASRNLPYKINLLVYICRLCTRFAAPWKEKQNRKEKKILKNSNPFCKILSLSARLNYIFC